MSRPTAAAPLSERPVLRAVPRTAEVDTRPRRILLVDDDRELCRAYARALRAAGHEVETAHAGQAALEAFQLVAYDAVVLDVMLPDVDGLTVLREVQRVAPDVPVLLMTGLPTLDTAIAAVERGAARYLQKPVTPGALNEAIVVLTGRDRAEPSSDRPDHGLAQLSRSFDNALATLFLAYQPIVDVASRTTFGYEALVRCREPSIPHPGALFAAAQRLGRLTELSRILRTKAPELLQSMDDVVLFMNLHARDLGDDAIVDQLRSLEGAGARMVLEISERASVDDLGAYRARILALRELGYRIAVDDLGAGYAGLTSFAMLEPEIVKIDMALVRGVDAAPVKQRIIRSVVSLCREMGVTVVAEGVETRDESQVLQEIGCALQQGYFFARPASPPPIVTFR